MPNTPIVISSATVIDGLLLFVDGYPDEMHRLVTRTGSEPLEDGRDVTDLAVAQPAELQFTAVVSDFGGASGARNPREAWGEIRRIHAGSELMTIVSEWGAYENMLITRAVATPYGRGMSIDLEITEVLIAGQVATQARQARPVASSPAANRTEEVARGRVTVVPIEVLVDTSDPRDDLGVRVIPDSYRYRPGIVDSRDVRDNLGERSSAGLSAHSQSLLGSPSIPDAGHVAELSREFARKRRARQFQEGAAEHDVQFDFGEVL